MASVLTAVQTPFGGIATLDERRQEPRLSVDAIPARVRIGENAELWAACVLDVSTSGLRLGLTAPILTGTEVTVWFERTVATGRVRYCRGAAELFEAGLLLTDALNIL